MLSPSHSALVSRCPAMPVKASVTMAVRELLEVRVPPETNHREINASRIVVFTGSWSPQVFNNLLF